MDEQSCVGPVDIIIPNGHALPNGAGFNIVATGTTCASLADALAWIDAHQPYTHAARLRLRNGRTLSVAEARLIV